MIEFSLGIFLLGVLAGVVAGVLVLHWFIRSDNWPRFW